MTWDYESVEGLNVCILEDGGLQRFGSPGSTFLVSRRSRQTESDRLRATGLAEQETAATENENFRFGVAKRSSPFLKALSGLDVMVAIRLVPKEGGRIFPPKQSVDRLPVLLLHMRTGAI